MCLYSSSFFSMPIQTVVKYFSEFFIMHIIIATLMLVYSHVFIGWIDYGTL